MRKMTAYFSTLALLSGISLALPAASADPLTSGMAGNRGALTLPGSDAEVDEELSRALIHSNEPRTQIMLQTSKTWDGGSFAYPEGEAQLTVVRISLPDGYQASFHCHPMPTFGYMASGRMRVETRNGDSIEFNAGDPVSEVMNTLHRSTVLEGPVELLVFYAGAKGQKTTYQEQEEGKNPCSGG